MQLPQASGDQNRAQLLAWQSVARAFQNNLLACKNGSVTACDMAASSPAASANDRQAIGGWREAASPWNRLVAAVDAVPQSTLIAGAAAIAMGLALIAILVRNWRYSGSRRIFVAEREAVHTRAPHAVLQAMQSVTSPSSPPQSGEKPNILEKGRQEEAAIGGNGEREDTTTDDEQAVAAMPPNSSIEGREAHAKGEETIMAKPKGSSTAGLILGILGGLFGLLIGFFGYVVGGLAGAGGQSGAGIFQFISMAIPVASLVGGGMARSNAMVAGILMLLSALGMLFFFGFNFFTAIPLFLSGIGGVMALISANDANPSAV